MQHVPVNIVDLRLDVLNPRTKKATDQKAAMKQMVEEQRDKLLNLCRTIIAKKGLSPLDRILVIKGRGPKGGYIVLEGNRRVAALKILSNPSWLDAASIPKSLRDKFDDLSSKFKKSWVEPIEVGVAGSRTEANYWIHLRHTGANEGAGVVDWSSIQRERFEGMSPQLSIVNFVRDFGQLSDAEDAALDGRFITTLKRLIDAPNVRSLLGLQKQGKKLLSEYPAPEIMKPLRRIVLDLAQKKIKVDSLKTVAAMEAYVQGFDPKELPNPATKTGAREITTFTAGDFASSSGKGGGSGGGGTGGGAGSQPKRLSIVPAGSALVVTDPRLSRIYKELRDLRLRSHRNATAVLFRVFFETSVDFYMKKHGMSTMKAGNKFKTLEEKVKETTGHLHSTMGDPNLFVPLINAISDPKSPLWIKLLHSYVHSAHGTPTKDNLEAAWDHASPLLAEIWK